MKKRFLSLLCVLALCLGLLPVTALAAEGAPETLFVGNQNVRSGDETTYWITDSLTGKLTQYTENGDAWNVKYEPNSATLTLKDAKISGSCHEYNNPFTAGIYAKGSSNQPVALTIELIGTNTITGTYGIYLDGHQGNTICTNASVLIKNGNESGESGSLTVNGTGSHGIYILSGTGNASLTIENASVVANATSSYSGSGVCVQSGANSQNSPGLSLTVNGGSLTTSGSASGEGIKFYVGAYGATSATTSLTVTDNAIVDARTGGISASGVSVNPNVTIGSNDNTSGIVWNGPEGTVYGDVTLDESLTINQGETLTIPEGSTLNSNGNLTNNGTIVNTGGTLNGEPGGIIVTAPAITTESLPEGTVNQLYSATLEVTGNNITWSLDSGTLPDGLTLDSNGTIVGTPTAAGTSTFTVTATNDAGSASKEYTLTIKAVSVTSLKLNKDSLTLQENSSDTLIATVKPDDATNRGVTWESSDTSIATVSEDGTVTAISAGNATITATAADGSGISASCTLTVTHGKMVQTPKKDATCTVDGTEEYWTCGICEKHFEDESGTIPTTPEKNKIPATGHSYGEPVWSWSEDGKTCKVTFTCEKDENHKETPEVTVTSAEKTPGTCTEAGVTTYTATVEFNGNTYTDTKDVADIPATGHSYGEPVWSWAEDGKTCKVTFTCEKDENHKKTPEVKVTSAVKTPATCTEKGVTTYTATVEFNGKTYTDTKDLADIPATGHSYDNGKCTVCGAIASDFKVIIAAGANGSWQKGTKDGLTFTSNAAYKYFQKVQVDGKDLDVSNYTVKEGSTIVTLKASYLETLSVGKHTISIVSETGTVDTNFTIKSAPATTDEDVKSPQTGDNSNMSLWIALLFVSGAGLLGAAAYNRKRKYNR